MKDKNSEQRALEGNTVVLANALELVGQVVDRVAGNAISNQINGQTATTAVLQEAAAARIQSVILNKVGGQ